MNRYWNDFLANLNIPLYLLEIKQVLIYCFSGLFPVRKKFKFYLLKHDLFSKDNNEFHTFEIYAHKSNT